MDLSRQANTNIPQQINVVGKFWEYDCTSIFFVSEK